MRDNDWRERDGDDYFEGRRGFDWPEGRRYCDCHRGPQGPVGPQGPAGPPSVLEYASAFTGLGNFQLIGDGQALGKFTGSTTSNARIIEPVNGTGDIILAPGGVYYIVYRVTAYEDGPFAPIITTFRVSTALTLGGNIIPGSQALQNVLVGGTVFDGENQCFPTASDVTGTVIVSTVGAQGTQILNLVNNALPLVPGVLPATLFRNVSITILKIR